MFGSMSSSAHQANIVLSEPMTSQVQRGSSLGSCPTFPSPNSHFKPTFGSLTLCQVLSGGKLRQIKPLASQWHPVNPAVQLLKIALFRSRKYFLPIQLRCSTNSEPVNLMRSRVISKMWWNLIKQTSQPDAATPGVTALSAQYSDTLQLKPYWTYESLALCPWVMCTGWTNEKSTAQLTEASKPLRIY